MTTNAETVPAEPASPLVALREMALTAPAAAASPAAAEPLLEAPAAAAPAKRPKKTWREERWERRRRRVWFEEMLGWILVPVIVVGLYYVAVALLGALGTSPAALMEGINVVLAYI